jgi:hypothetical protein
MKRPIRFFNTTGPCNPDDHYMLPPEERLVGAQLHRYIRDKLYWSLHAPRQTGKTTFLLDWMRKINAGDEAVACYVSVESAQGLEDRKEAIETICKAIQSAANKAGLPVPSPRASSGLEQGVFQLNEILSDWAALVAPKPLVALFDEVDVLQGDALVSFLRQLRDGFAERGAGKFPVSIALVGMRDLKDYITAAKDGVPVNPGSPFNIKADSVLVSNFTREDVVALFAQRTAETGQGIEPTALDYVWEQTRGQPWIVNNLFMRATMRILRDDDYRTVTLAHIEQARQQMILARETHLDSLVYRLEDKRVREVMETLMTGEPDQSLAESDGFRLCLDLGLVVEERGTPQVANPIYREVLARQMTYGQQRAIPESDFRWRAADGGLDMDALLKEFQKFWRRNSEVWEERSNYTEAFPHLLLQAFLQRVLNGGGRIEREYAAGRGRMDLYVEYGGQGFIIEIKLIHSYDDPAVVLEEGLEQTARYRDKTGGDALAYLVIFDRRDPAKKAPWDERISWTQSGGITVAGC